MIGHWMGARVEILRGSGMWVTVKFLDSCQYFKKGTVICISDCHITLQRMPLIREKRVPAGSFRNKFSIVGHNE